MDKSTKQLAEGIFGVILLAVYGGPFCQDTGEGDFKVETSPFSRRLAELCSLSLVCGVATGAT